MVFNKKPEKKGKPARSFFLAFKKWFWPTKFWRKLLVITASLCVLFTATSFGVAQWYIRKHSHEPMILGTTFVPSHAQSYGLDPKQTLQAILSDLNIKQVRLMSYWDQIEAQQGTYDFSQLDWQMEMAKNYNAQVSLAIGLRQPRWPECHPPQWSQGMTKDQWQPKLYDFISAVVNRYKDHAVLNTYELENEFFLTVFGECKDFDRARLVEEFNLVKKLDPDHVVIISRSNNWVGIPVGEPTADQFGISIYKRVWDKTITKRYFEYPLPAWFYASLAGWGQIATGKDMVIHELQAEPWPPTDIQHASLPEQYKSMDPKRLKGRIEYGKATGMRNIDLWGAEWWYWLKVKKNEPAVWEVVKQAVAQSEADNQKLRSK